MFTQLLTNERLLKALDTLNFNTPTPVQAESIPHIISGSDILASAKTGSGKTAAFLLPMLQRFMDSPEPNLGCRALILVPTRELAQQTYQQFKQLASYSQVTACVICGGEDFKYQKALLRKNPEIIIATPGRLLEHLSKNSTDFNDLAFLVLDEADRMLDMGFSDDVMTIANQCNDKKQTLLFSATLQHKAVAALATSILNNPVSLQMDAPDTAHSDIQHQMMFIDDQKHKQQVLTWLLANQTFDKALVFTNTKAEAQRLTGLLKYHKFQVSCLHGDMEQAQRKQVIQAFRRSSNHVLIATDVAARGLDIPGVDCVVQYDMSRSSEDYVHRSGRTGRAGSKGLCIVFIGSRDWDNKARCENALGIKLKKRSAGPVEAKYQGPKKVKKSGKAAATKKRKPATTSKTKSTKPKSKSSSNTTTQTKQKSAVRKAGRLGDGTAAFTLKKP